MDRDRVVRGEVHAIENGTVVGIYVGEMHRAASWARRANPSASLRAHLQSQDTSK